MRLVTRLSSTLAVVGVGVFGVYGAWVVSRERADLYAAVAREAVFLATSLGVGVENALRDGQVPDVEEATRRLEGLDTSVDVFVFDPNGALIGSPVGTVASPDWRRLVAAVRPSPSTEIVWVPAAHPTHLVIASPLLADDGAALGRIVIVRPLDDVNDDLLATVGSVAITVGGFVLLAATVGLAVGQARLGHPIDRLIAEMHAIRTGRASTPVAELGDDEFVALATAFNTMVRDLDAARSAAAAEADARREASRLLSEANRLITLGQLSAAVAHEIGSPMQVVLGRARALVIRSDDPAETRRVAEILVRECERIVHIVAQLLTLTRRHPPRREPVDLPSVVRLVVSLFEIEARWREVRVVAEAGSAPPVSGDPDELQQVLLNLLSNALHASQPGGTVVVKVAGSDPVRLEVADDGAGMDEATQRRAFEPLFTTRSDQGGAGLGLAVVRRIVSEHGGEVVIGSAVGRGTTVTVTLPARNGGTP